MRIGLFIDPQGKTRVVRDHDSRIAMLETRQFINLRTRAIEHLTFIHRLELDEGVCPHEDDYVDLS